MALIDARGQVIVQTNCGSADEARSIARAAVEAGLAACGNVHGPIGSVYRWEGAVVEAEEHVVVLKTTRERLSGLETLVRARHGYDLPAFLVLPIEAGEAGYLDWITREAAGPPIAEAAPVQKDGG